MILSTLIQGLNCRTIGNLNTEIRDIQFDSRKVADGCLFVAIVGLQADGHDYITKAIENHAAAIVCSKVPETTHKDVCYIQVTDSNAALAYLADRFYGHPSQMLKLIGITGTNGKTTTVTLLHRMARMAGRHAGLISTIVNKIDDQEIPTQHTTPDALELNALLRKMADAGCTYCFMEVSSHAVVQHRIGSLTFAGGIFSNITHDHLDYHKTMANYIAAKKGFFDMLPKEAFALVNIDDRNGMVMVQNCKATIKTYSLRQIADYRCKVVENTFQGLLLEINGKEVWTRLVGRFNAYNLTAIYATATLIGIAPDNALLILSQLKAADGRFEYVNGKGITAIVDYAHTPDALENVLQTIHDIRTHNQQIITVVGCGGDRDSSKRPEMARIAVQKSDTLILTADNPRSENPESILNDMEAGLSNEQKSNTLRITDRRQAIRTACKIAHEGDIILVAGKGHEKYQEINGVRTHFDDREELENLLLQND
ncbi:MAG: UDP-N-acetylmuramoyl-L-alanyl-D-glutamate--2,6-diaminopimelate ligase [Bacteroidales bacterium]|nr:UDP-N-acetylmuramoyl-L-alanyl-D-glutamate--2,6-diaminopimelate ligase [Candidatus Colimorpha onthohippi]